MTLLKMVSTNMCQFVEDVLIARYPDGTPMLYGVFCVAHKSESDRLIFDGRCPSAGEIRLRWMRLPHGSQLARVRLRPHQSIRGSGGDLRTYFYALREHPLIFLGMSGPGGRAQ